MITQRQLADIARLTADRGLDHTTASHLRQGCTQEPTSPTAWTTTSTTWNPRLEGTGFNLYLVDGRQHCLRLTSDLQVATGIVLAAVLEESN